MAGAVYRIHENDALGRHLVTARALPAGSAVLSELPRAAWRRQGGGAVNATSRGGIRTCVECGVIVGSLADLVAAASVEAGPPETPDAGGAATTQGPQFLSQHCAALLADAVGGSAADPDFPAAAAKDDPTPDASTQRECLEGIKRALAGRIGEYEAVFAKKVLPCQRGVGGAGNREARHGNTRTHTPPASCDAVFCSRPCYETSHHHWICPVRLAEDTAGADGTSPVRAVALADYHSEFGFNERFMFMLTHYCRYWWGRRGGGGGRTYDGAVWEAKAGDPFDSGSEGVMRHGGDGEGTKGGAGDDADTDADMDADDENAALLGVSDYDDAGMPLRPTPSLRNVLRRAAVLINLVLDRRGVPSVTPQALLQLLNIYNANCHTTITLSPLFALRAHLRELEGTHPGLVKSSDGSASASGTADVVCLLNQFFALAHPLSTHAHGAGLFYDAACANHSCRPSCHVVPTSGHTHLAMRTLREIEEGEHLTISYIDAAALAGRPFTRRAQLSGYGFACRCDGCLEEREGHAAAWVAAAVAVVAAAAVVI